MEEMYRTHKEPAWGWVGALLAGRKPRPSPARARKTPARRLVVTPWSLRSLNDWSA